jgi:hypothetical protein
MNCAEAESLIPDLLAETLELAERAALQAHFRTCPACAGEAAGLTQLWADLERPPAARPGPGLRSGFYAMLAAEQAAARGRRWRTLLQVAASLLLASGGFLAGYGFRGGPEPPPARRELALFHQDRTELRLAGVMLTAQGDPEDAVPAEALLDLLERDPSVPVRLAAVDALYLYGRQPRVRERLAAALARQQSPRVQLALIDLLAGLRERAALEALRKLLRGPGLTPEVRDRAQTRLAGQPL